MQHRVIYSTPEKRASLRRLWEAKPEPIDDRAEFARKLRAAMAEIEFSPPLARSDGSTITLVYYPDEQT